MAPLIPVRPRLTALTLALAGLLGVSGLAGCDSNVGTAAAVGNQSISESQVSQYLTAQSTPFPNQSGQTVEPKPLIVTFLIREALARQLLAQTPQGVPDTGDLQQAETSLLQQANESRSNFVQLYTGSGFKPAAADLAIRSNTLISILANRLGTDPNGQRFLQQHDVSIRVDPRYGSWQPSSLSVSGTAGDQLPFLKLQSPVVGAQ